MTFVLNVNPMTPLQFFKRTRYGNTSHSLANLDQLSHLNYIKKDIGPWKSKGAIKYITVYVDNSEISLAHIKIGSVIWSSRWETKGLSGNSIHLLELIRCLQATSKKFIVTSPCAALKIGSIDCHHYKASNMEAIEYVTNFGTFLGYPFTGLSQNVESLFKLWLNCLEVFGVFNVQDALKYWVSGWFPLMKVSFHNNTLWARCFQGEGNVRNMK